MAIMTASWTQDVQILTATKPGVATQDTNTHVLNKYIKEHLNPGEPIQVNVGQKFVIKISANPTTGYGWTLKPSPNETVVVLVTNRYIQKRTGTRRVGVGGHELWTFEAIGRGQAVISMNYARPWEKDVPPIRTNVFTVIVK